MSALAAALLDSLGRLLPAAGTGAPHQAPLAQVVEALAAALEQGDLALDLEGPQPWALPQAAGAPQDTTTTASADDWPAAHLAALEAMGWLVEAAALDSRPEAPVVRDGRWLRWRRWHAQLVGCREALIARGRMALSAEGDSGAALAPAGLDPQQCRAVQALLDYQLVLLSGGPGTGKTSTVVQMLAAALRQTPGLRLHLAAPTGKAASRLEQAIQEGCRGLEPALAASLQSLPCGTLHRLLEARGQGGGFRRGRERPLELDLLVVDEVSMVDLPLMGALLEALPPQARLLLVGDPAQLAPVGPGAVLLELCRPESLRALGPAAVQLQTTYRNDGAIAAIAARLRRCEQRGPQLLTALQPELASLKAEANVHWRPAPANRPPAEALDRLRRHQQQLAALAQASDDGALLRELEQLILLSPVQRGPWGVDAIHRALLGERLQGPLQRWPEGTPVLNRRNLEELDLANGDVGVLVNRNGERWVLFGQGRLLHPARLGAAEPALALTVHKAQGSQYAEVLLLVPPHPRLEARLLYTGLTRARRQAWIYSPGAVDDSPP